MARNTFIDPASDYTWVWPRNHKTENTMTRTRHIEELVPAAHPWQPGLRPVRQQGVATPLAMSLQGTAPDAMHERLVHFFSLCASQTIWFLHFDGPEWEVQITRYQPTRRRDGKAYVHDYALEMEIFRSLI